MKFKATDLHNSREKLYQLPKELKEEIKKPKEEARMNEEIYDDHGDVIIGNRNDTPYIKKP